MSIDVVQAVRDGKGKFEWKEVLSEHNGYQLYISVFRDAMKFDAIPAMQWDWDPIATNHPDFGQTYDGVRLPATAHQLQEIADLVNGMLMTPRVIDLVWLQADLKFDAAVNTAHPTIPKKRVIVATSDIQRVHMAIEAKIAKAGGDDGTKLISCVGKYWCLIQQLANKGMLHGDWTSCNYGWFAKKASGPGLTKGTSCYQRPGYRHNKRHWDPSQTIRLMYQWGRLIHPDGTESHVFLPDLMCNLDQAGLVTHDGKALTYIRQKGVDQLDPLGTITLPEVTIVGGSGDVA